MYEKTVNCANYIKNYRDAYGKSYDYVISTREDAIVLKEMNLKELLPMLKSKHFSGPASKCDILSKDCLSWGGISIRLWLFTEEVGLKFLSSILDWYKELIRKRRRIYNPEQFNADHLKHMNLEFCGISVNQMPVTAARHTKNENYCFIHQEYNGCIPSGLEDSILSKKC